MNLSDLLAEDRVKKVQPDRLQAQECLKAAGRDVRVAKKMLAEDFDWAFSVAYNAMLQSARALMFADGYAPVGENHHKIAVDYADVKLGTKFKEKVELFDDMRKKRHKAVYEKVGAISEYEARHAIETADDFLRKVREKLGAEK
ncbi:HEPN domain protein [Candidatus Burarchaeum australiense]|nr:HEPN domain protein [Candidatus Burarchaeum australiense]